MNQLHILWKKGLDGNAVIYRVFGREKHIIIPEKIGGIPVTGIGDYCFSASSKIPEDVIETDDGMSEDVKSYIRELSGNYIESVSLPDTITSIGNLAFYNCGNLKKIEAGAALNEIGSDVFMNCTNLHELYMRCSAKSRTGLLQILGRIFWEIKVAFETDGEIEVLVVYPEYFETYDEIAPAHIFGRNIEGEGFRARQCFENGVIALEHYDRIFAKASVEEKKKTLFHMAVSRLVYPFELTEEHRREYEQYILKNDEEVAEWLVNLKWIKALEELHHCSLFSGSALNTAIVRAADTGWSEGAAFLMQLRHRKSVSTKAERYQF